MIAIYTRVSSASQKADSQRAELERWIAGNNPEGAPVKWFQDIESGKDLNRPGFAALQAAIFSGEVRTVVCWKLDRLSRDLRDGVNLLADWCDRGIRVVAITQQLDLSGAIGRMIAAVLFGLAEAERNTIRERQAAGIALAKERGTYTGRAKGTTKAKPTRARDLQRQGLTIPEIARAMGTSERTIFRYLNATQTGTQAIA